MNWKETILKNISECIIDCPHSTPQWTEKGVLVLRNYNIRNGRLDLSDISYTTEEGYIQRTQRAVPRDGDLIFTREAPMGEVCILPKDLKCCLGQRMVMIRPDKRVVDNNYLLFAMQSDFVKHQISWSEGTGSTVSNIRIPVIENFKIPLPPLPEQRAIAEILSSIDDKIELNNQMNRTLEAMAQAIFKQWFVDFKFPQNSKASDSQDPLLRGEGGPQVKMIDSELGPIPAGWRVGKFNELVKYVSENTKSGDHLMNLPYVPIEEISKKQIYLTSYKSWQEANSSLILFKKYDILFGAMRPYFHKVCFAPFDGITRKTCFVLRPLNKFDLAYSLFVTFSKSTIDFATSHSEGSTIPYAIWNNSLENMRILIPTEDIRIEFNNLIIPILELMTERMSESQTLSALRDSLLPKLMSGELRVPEEIVKRYENV